MGIPQILFISIYMFSFGVVMTQHGKPKTGKYHIGYSLFSIILTFGLLIWGGFFK